MSILGVLDSCCNNLVQSNATLHASLTSVTEGTEDYPRLMRVLTNERVYELVSQDEILQAQLEIQREVEPQIKELIQLAEEGLYELQQRERNLNDTAENRKQAEARKKIAQEEKARALPPVRTGAKTTAEGAKLKARLMALQIERENLLKEVERLQADVDSKKAAGAG
ncbi:hypothetical protein P389DRAFT_167182 [Cystobasidium minutum MCA 4210]|uniref:uncharacterized protein n=1 Tax=Cystobasidium minutum MCA 4210 TaxID=1397322 RepID=UPI0034CE3FCC|eukprot:jgi/Rhomi1/167182/fgenesh1_kg.2_\